MVVYKWDKEKHDLGMGRNLKKMSYLFKLIVYQPLFSRNKTTQKNMKGPHRKSHEESNCEERKA